MNRIRILSFLCFCLGALILAGHYAAADDHGKPVYFIKLKGAIGPAIADFMARGIHEAESEYAQAIVVELDTPGGLLTSTRDMAQTIIDADIPVIVYVSPSGAHAASAGTFITYASHIAAMAPGTNIGAATPINMGGKVQTESKDANKENVPSHPMDHLKDIKDKMSPDSESMKRKALEDTTAFIRGLAEMRGRNVKWGELAVTDADSLTAKEALEKDVIEYIAQTRDDLMRQIDGKTITLKDGKNVTLHTASAPLKDIEIDFLTQFLIFITDPNVAVILMSIGFYGIILEFYNPGTLIPGVIGAISLTIGLYAMNVLPINLTGAILAMLGAAFMIAEIFIPSFGIMGLGGFAAFVAGMALLFQTDGMMGIGIDWGVIMGIAVTGLVLIGASVWMAATIMMKRVTTGQESLIGDTAKILSWDGKEGKILLHGEHWSAYSDVDMDFEKDDEVKVEAFDDLRVKITFLS